MSSDDFRLCNDAYCCLEQVGEEPSDELYQTIVLAWSASGAIGNGGFEYLFEGAFYDRDPNYQGTLAAFERIGALTCAAAFREALGWLGAPSPSDSATRLEQVEGVSGDVRERVNRAFWSGKEELERQLAAYIRGHRAELDARRSTAVGQLGDLRIQPPNRLLQLRRGAVARSFELEEWRAELSVQRALFFGSAWGGGVLVLAGLAFSSHPVWIIPAAVAAAVAVHALRPRAWLVLSRGADRVRLGGWPTWNGQVFSFVAEVAKRSKSSCMQPEGEDDIEQGS